MINPMETVDMIEKLAEVNTIPRREKNPRNIPEIHMAMSVRNRIWYLGWSVIKYWEEHNEGKLIDDIQSVYHTVDENFVKNAVECVKKMEIPS